MLFVFLSLFVFQSIIFFQVLPFFSDHPPPLLSGNWVFDLHASEHVEIILAVMTRKEKKIKHRRGDRKAEPDEAEVGLRAPASQRLPCADGDG